MATEVAPEAETGDERVAIFTTIVSASIANKGEGYVVA